MAETTHRQKLQYSKEETGKGGGSGTVTDEIYEAVYKDVMEAVCQNLSQMKPQLVREITDAVFARMEEKCGKMLEKPEEKAVQKNGRSKEKKETGSYGKSERVDVREIYDEYKVGGWIYYTNDDDGGFLYKVREDGSCNTQLTDYAVYSDSLIAERGYLYFEDLRTFTERKIKLED